MDPLIPTGTDRSDFLRPSLAREATFSAGRYDETIHSADHSNSAWWAMPETWGTQSQEFRIGWPKCIKTRNIVKRFVCT